MGTHRTEIIRQAIQYAAGRNGNTPATVRRILKQKFGIDDVLELEIEASAHDLAGAAVARITDLLRESK